MSDGAGKANVEGASTFADCLAAKVDVCRVRPEKMSPDAGASGNVDDVTNTLGTGSTLLSP